VCLGDGAYTLRALGACDPCRDKFRFQWTACGITDGGATEQITFTLANGTCSPGTTRVSSDDMCSEPSGQPSNSPSSSPSGDPSASPSGQPTGEPSVLPSAEPSVLPSAEPSGEPSVLPSAEPSASPSGEPTAQPSILPSAQPTSVTPQPSHKPSAAPSAVPKAQTKLTVAGEFSMNGMSADQFDTDAEDSFEASVADSSNGTIASKDVAITNVTDVNVTVVVSSRRKLLASSAGMSIKVAFVVTVVIEDLGLVPTNAFATLHSVLVKAVDSSSLMGRFNSNMGAAKHAKGQNFTAVVLGGFVMSEEDSVMTVVSTTRPSAPPTPQPTGSNGDDKGTGDDDGAVTMVIVAALAVFVVGVCLVAGLVRCYGVKVKGKGGGTTKVAVETKYQQPKGGKSKGSGRMQVVPLSSDVAAAADV
jgi:hypothetical protein